MILVFDIGNTSTSLGLYHEDKILHKWRIPTDVKKSEDDIAVDIVEKFLTSKVDCMLVDGVVIGSVVPTMTTKLKSAISKFLNASPIIIGEDSVKLGIKIKVKNKYEVGVDRLLNAIAGYELFGGDLIVIDFGTATTFDIVGSNGDYMGGVICAGINLSLKALYDMTAQLPMITVRPQKNVIGKSTMEAMNSGIYFGYSAMVDGVINRIEQEYGSPMKKIITGGFSDVLKDSICEPIDAFEPDLTLLGMKLVYDRNIISKK